MGRRKKQKLEIEPLEGAPDYIRVLIYGAPKTGKTVIGATASKANGASPVIIADVERGTLSLHNAPTSLVDKKRIGVRRIEKFEDFNYLYDFVAENPGFKTLVIDTITEAHTLAMKEVMKEVIRKDPTREEFTPSPREWGIVRAQIRMMVSHFLDLPINLVLLAHLREEKDDMGTLFRSVQLPGQLSTEIPGYMDIVGFLSIEMERRKPNQKAAERKVKRVLHLGNISRTVAGIRAWDTPDSIEDPTFETIRSTLIGE